MVTRSRINLLKITLAIALGAFVSLPSRADPQVCATLLFQSLIEPDPNVIAATLYRIFAKDFPILLHHRFNRHLMVNYGSTFKSRLLYSEADGLVWNNDIQKLLDTEKRVRTEYTFVDTGPYPEGLKKIAESVWGSIRSDFEKEKWMDSFSYYPEIDRARFESAAQTLRVVHATPLLHDAMISIIVHHAATLEEWLPDFYSRRREHPALDGAARKKRVERTLKSQADLALPSLREILGVPNPPLTVTLDLAHVTRAFEAVNDPAMLERIEGIVNYDRELLVNFQTLSAGISSVRDHLLAHPIWNRFYDVTGAWMHAGTETKSTALKHDFVNAALQILGLVDAHFRQLQSERHVIAIAEASVRRKIDDLSRAIERHPPGDTLTSQRLATERTRALRRINDLHTDVEALDRTLEAWSDDVSEGYQFLRRLHHEVMAGPIFLADPEGMRASLEKIRDLLKLSPELPARLEKNGWKLPW